MRKLNAEVEAAAAYEFVLSLGVLAAARVEPGGAGRGWFDAATRLAGADFVAEVRDFSGGYDYPFVHLLPLAFEQPPPRSVAGFVSAVRRTYAPALKLHLVGHHVRYFRRATPPAVIAQAVAGDPAAIAEFTRTSYPGDAGWQRALACLLADSPDQTRRRLLAILEHWRRPFEELCGEGVAQLTREADLRRAQARALGAEHLAAVLTGGWQYVREPGIRSLLLIPSLVCRPDVHLFDHAETKIAVYPVRPETGAESAGVAAGSELLAMATGLADGSRLRVLRQLAMGPATPGDLGLALGIRPSTLSHHLAILEKGRLVTAAGPLRRRRYALREEGLRELTEGLAALLAREST